MFSRLSLAAGAAVGGLVVFLAMQAINAVWLLPLARSEGRELERSAQLGRSMEIIKERGRTNAAINSLSDANLCHELGGVWVRADKRCD